MIRKVFLMMAIAIAVTIVPFSVSAAEQDNNEFRTYKVSRGDWLSEVAWTLGVPIAKLTEWNRDVVEEGVRELPTGVELRYKPPGVIYDNVKEEQMETRRELKALINQKGEELAEKIEGQQRGEELAEKIKGQEEETRQTVRKGTNKVQNGVNDLFGLEILTFSILVGFLVVILILLVVLLLMNRGQKEDDSSGNDSSGDGSSFTPSGASASTSSSSFDTNKLKRLEQVKLSPETGEEEVEFHLGGHKFKGLIPYDANRGHQTWQLKPDNSNEYHYSNTKQNALKSFKRSLKNYLVGTPSNKNQIEKAISGGKIQKIS